MMQRTRRAHFIVIAALCGCATGGDSGLTELPGLPVPELEPTTSVPTIAPTAQVRSTPQGGHHRIDNGAGLVYDGEWSNGLYHGVGTLTEPDGRVYSGEWNAGKREGTGRQAAPDGTIYDGAWMLNRPSGAGTRAYRNGIEMTGLWNGDSLSNGLVALPSGPTYAGPVLDTQENKRHAKFIEWLTELARRKDRYALFLLAQTPTGNEPERIRWLQQSAVLGLADAQFAYAVETGDAEFLQKAADQQHPDALRYLAESTHAAGNPSLAYRYATQAIEQGATAAIRLLAWWLSTDPGASPDSGKRAVALVRNIAITTSQWQYLDTLAAATARSGDPDSAASIQARAIQQARSAGAGENTLNALTERLARYTAGQPFEGPAGYED